MSVIIGAKKAGENLPLMSGEEIKELIQGAERLLEQGVPLEVPAAVRVGDLVRISSTMKRYRELLVDFAGLMDTLRDHADAIADGEPQLVDCPTLFDLEEKIQEVINIAPPPLVQPSPLLEV